jgi:spoIIIJ-associated protein
MENETPIPPSADAPQPSTALAKQTLSEMLTLLEIEATIDEYQRDGQTVLHIESRDAGRLIGKQGWTLNDLQFLLNVILMRRDPAAPRIVVDVERYRERQREEMLKKIFDAIDRVKRWGEPIMLEPMNAYDRRLVHQTVARDPELESHSDDSTTEGTRKSVTIRIKRA